MKDKGSHPFICGVRGAHFRCGFKANGVAGAGGFLHTFTDDLRILLVPVSHLVSSGFSIASAHAFMNSKAGYADAQNRGPCDSPVRGTMAACPLGTHLDAVLFAQVGGGFGKDQKEQGDSRLACFGVRLILARAVVMALCIKHAT